MSVISYLFLAFLFITIVVYYIVPKKLQWVVLLIASLIFYGYAGIPYLIVILAEAAIVYFISMKMQKNLDEQDKLLEGADRRTARKIRNEMKVSRKKYVRIGLTIVIVILVFFKGTGFIVENINRVLSLAHAGQLSAWSLAAPLGVSFYSFMMISYLADLYSGRISAQRNYLKYLTYVLYFPHITQGPIARYEETGPELLKEHRFDYDAVIKGGWLIIWGYFKKLIIADRVSAFVTDVFGGSSNLAGHIFLLAAIVYAIQIYCDFSGCMDIVRGASECFGIPLIENFRRPYFSQTLPEFWRRWHISLGAFFREYIFYPVSTSKIFLDLNTKARKHFGNDWGRNIASCVPILCVWVLTGVWHGANWNYIGWGVYHGVLISLSTMFEQPIAAFTEKLHIPVNNPLWKLFRILRTFFLCMIGRIIFMGNGIRNSLWMIKSLFFYYDHSYNILEKFSLNGKEWFVVIIASILLLIVSIVQEVMQAKDSEWTVRCWLARRNIVIRWAVLLAGIMCILIFGVYGSGAGATFIYEQF